jgi:hypothetical protein
MTTGYCLNDIVWSTRERFLAHCADLRIYLLASYVAKVLQVGVASDQSIPRSEMADQGMALFDAAG